MNRTSTYQKVMTVVYALTLIAALVVAFFDVTIWRN
jgi:hypothetical protein